METIEQVNNTNQNSFDAFKKSESKSTDGNGTVSKTTKGGKKVAAKVTKKKQTGPKKQIVKKTPKKKTGGAASANSNGQVGGGGGGGGGSSSSGHKKKSISTKVKESNDKYRKKKSDKIFPAAPINRTFVQKIAILNEQNGGGKNIVSKKARERVVANASQKFLGLVNRISVLMDYKGIKTMNETTVNLAILMEDSKFDWSKMNDEIRFKIHNMLNSKIKTIE